MQVTLMHNPKAGSGKPSAEELLEALNKAGYRTKYQSTKEDNWEEALQHVSDMILIAGGDGTIGKVAKKLKDNNTPLTFLPIGTANNIAKTFQLKGSALQIIDEISAFKKSNFNVGVVKGPWGEKRFIEAVGFGIFPKMMKEYDELKDENVSKEEEVKAALRFIKDIVKDAPAYPCTIKVDGETFSDDYLLVEVMNIKTMGPNLPLASDANPGDDFFEIVMITAKERAAFSEYLEAYIKRETPAIDLTVRKGSHIEISWQKFSIHIDDDLWPENEDKMFKLEEEEENILIDITMEKEKLQIFVPSHLNFT